MSISSLTYRTFQADIDISNIKYQAKINKHDFKVILDDISTSFQHGKLHAIVGPSGCGKSSLLNVLAGFNGIAKGEISLNGCRVDLKAWKDTITPVRSYILQDDFLISELTVKEQLRYAVEFKVPNGVSFEERSEIVETLLQEIGLKECEDIRLGQVSGGQRKRVSVASELVNYQPVLFLDEPTSGLDSTSCYRLVDTLKSVARSGCNVIASIHQPNSRVFAMFDTLTVLNKAGKIAFIGPAAALAETMQLCINMKVSHVENPAEVLFERDNIKRLAEYDDIRRRRIIEHIGIRDEGRSVQSWSRMEGDGMSSKHISFSLTGSSNNDSTMTTTMSAEDIKSACILATPSSTKRFQALFKRTMLQSQRDYEFMAGRLIACFLTSLLVGILFQFVGNDGSKLHSNVAMLYFIVTITLMAVGIVTIMHTHQHFDVFLREHINSWYEISHFYITRALIELATNVFIATIFPLFMWLMTAQTRLWWPTILILPLIITLNTTATHHLCLLPAMFADRASLPQLPFAVVMLQTVFGGFFILFEALPAWIFWGRYLITSSFTFIAVMKLAYRTSNNQSVLISCETESLICMAYKTGDDVLTAYGIDPAVSYWTEIVALAAHSVGWFLIGWMLVGIYLRRERNAVARL